MSTSCVDSSGSTSLLPANLNLDPSHVRFSTSRSTIDLELGAHLQFAICFVLFCLVLLLTCNIASCQQPNCTKQMTKRQSTNDQSHDELAKWTFSRITCWI